MTLHYELCKKTAERFKKDCSVILIEYQNWVTSEFPDVLCFKHDNRTIIYEIKTDFQDFKRDHLKECRIKYRIKYWPKVHYMNEKIKGYLWGKPELEEFILEAPHLGFQRYYVCPKELIKVEDIKNNWGLYWHHNGKFYQKKKSAIFRRDIFAEQRLLIHAMRAYASGVKDNIVINAYEAERSK